MREATVSVPGIARAGILAGLLGAVSIDAYLLTIYVAVSHSLTVAQFYQYVASGAVGKAASASEAFVGLGVAVHLTVSLGWGIGFAYLAARTPQLLTRPLVSGLVYGLVVLMSMWLVEFAAGIWHFPTIASVEQDVVAHCLFYGLPVAYVVSRTLRRA